MAYVRQPNVLDDETEVSGVPYIISPSGNVQSESRLGARTVNPNTQKTGTSGFTNLQRYLDSNQGGAQQLGQKVAGALDTARQGAVEGMETATGNFTGKVGQATNIWNPNLVDKAAKDASSYLTNETLGKQLSGTYAGPTNYAGSEEDIAAQKELRSAHEKQLMAGDVGGRTQLIRNIVNTPGVPQTTQGGLNLNQFLVQNTAPVYNKVKTAADSIEPLAQTYLDRATELQRGVQAAQKTNLNTRELALQRLGQGTTDLQKQITDMMTQRQAQLDAAAKNKVYQDLASAGATPEQIAAYQTADAAAKKYGGPGVDFRNYITREVADRLGTKDVANAAQEEDLLALSKLTGVNENFLQGGSKGTGPKIDINSILGQLQGQETEGMYRKQLADQKAAAEAAAAAQAAENARAEAAAKAQQAAALKAQEAQQAAIAAELQRLIDAQKAAAAAAAKPVVTAPTTPRENAPNVPNESKPVTSTTPAGVTQADLLKYKKGDKFDKSDWDRWAKATGYKGAYFDINTLPKTKAAASKPVVGESTGGSGTGGGGTSSGISAPNDASDQGNAVGTIGSPVGNSTANAVGAAIGTAIGIGPAIGGLVGQGINAAIGMAPASAPVGNTNAAAAAQMDAQAQENASQGGGGGSSSSSGDSADGSAGVGVGEGGIGSSGAGTAAGDAAGNSEGSGGAADGSGSAGDSGGGGGGGGGKIICTMMNDFYGLPYNENKVWIKYATTHLKPEHQKGYHKVFLPLVAFAKKPGYLNNKVRNMLFYIGKHRTIDIQAELNGTYRRPVHKFLRSVIEPTLAFIGRITK